MLEIFCSFFTSSSSPSCSTFSPYLSRTLCTAFSFAFVLFVQGYQEIHAFVALFSATPLFFIAPSLVNINVDFVFGARVTSGDSPAFRRDEG